MSVTLYTGTPGSGKSFHAAKDIERRLRRGGGLICNFPVNEGFVKKCRAHVEYWDNSELTAERLVAQIHQEGIGVRAKGILFVMPLTAASAKAAALLTALAPAEEEELTVEKHIRQSLILIAVNQGCTEEVMNTAREAGARGGTVIRSHTLRSAEQESFGGPTFAGEREILAIVASQSERNAIMEKVDAVHGGEAEARAVLYALPIEAAAHLN